MFVPAWWLPTIVPKVNHGGVWDGWSSGLGADELKSAEGQRNYSPYAASLVAVVHRDQETADRPLLIEDQHRRRNHGGPQAAFVTYRRLRHIRRADDFV